MTITERIIKLIKQRKMTQVEFARQIGIANSTISEWKKKGSCPSADKVMDICNVLKVTPEQLLTGKGIDDEEDIATSNPESRFTPYDIQIIDNYHNLREEQQKRLVAYMETLKKLDDLENL
ncbi:MAG: helix-turn-helix domain-containing protein [Lachnospiraceae bacterium]|nr:helix-turn-helix domain-containing protein [Lachnospiraceae bacterium]